jgi:hypothetical protein
MNISKRNAALIDMKDLNDLQLLKANVIYSDEFMLLPKERQSEMYNFCKCNATYPACLENLKQMRYAVSEIYFGW